LLLSVAVVICQCRHLTEDRKDGRHRADKEVGRKQWKLSKSLRAAEEEERMSSSIYEPIVVKLEVHFARKRKKIKSAVMDAANRTSLSLSSSTLSSPGFIHLFLPLNLPPAASAAATTFRPEVTQQAPDKKKQSLKRRKKTKKKKKKKQPSSYTPSSFSSSSSSSSSKADASIAAPVSDDVSFRETNHRLLPLLQDDGIPPLLNSLSSNETQQWARWLRCTLCLKNDKHSEKDSALCLHSVGCQSNSSVENELTASGASAASGCQDSDICSQWQNCENQHQIPSLFAALPPCPCTYPTGLVYNDRVWDPLRQQHYRWREISLESERVDIYRPGAAYCIRSLSVVPKLALAAQQCCYDHRRRLLTRGWATGTPALVSPEASLHLSRVTERIPWLACKGDFSRYHLQRPPDNRLNCSTNPSDEEFQRQVLLATNY